MRCTNCGVEMVAGAAFCPSCGKSVTTTPAMGSSAQGTSSGLQSNVASLLFYVLGFISGIFFLVTEPYKHDHFVRFHAFQAVFLSVAWIAVHFTLEILFGSLPLVFWRVSWLFSSLGSFGFFILVLFLMFKGTRRSSSSCQ
jgi:uncharacterized membrane protein